jgi:hypothetical protein
VILGDAAAVDGLAFLESQVRDVRCGGGRWQCDGACLSDGTVLAALLPGAPWSGEIGSDIVAVAERCCRGRTNIGKVVCDAKEICAEAFRDSSVGSVSIGKNVLRMGESCFEDCRDLITVDFQGSVVSVPKRCFFRAAIRKIVIPATVEEIGEKAFAETFVREAEFEEGSKLRRIGPEAFATCRLVSVTLPGPLKQIERAAFRGCRALGEVAFREGPQLEVVEENAFVECGIQVLFLPATAKSVHERAVDAGVEVKLGVTVPPVAREEPERMRDRPRGVHRPWLR